jgi:acetylornithine/N-succinyldiaminopimelate aminotransferase
MNIITKEKELFLHAYNRIPVDISHGEGVYLFDKAGNRYLDFFSGLCVNALGHSHPEIIEAVSSQIKRFSHLSNTFITDIQVEFAEKLLKYSGMSKVFLSNSGTEAVEGTIKIIRRLKGPDKKIFSFTGSFHGRTYGALTLTSKQQYREGFEPLLPNIELLKFNDLNDLNKINENTAAVFIEFIQGEGGIVPASNEFAEQLNNLREKFGFILAADEIQNGIGRTGKPFAYNHYNIKPDIVIAAKAIGGGLPLGAIMVDEKLSDVFETGKHGTTFGGNPVACAAGKVVLENVFEKGLIESVRENGNYFFRELMKLKSAYPDDIKEVRSKGFMIGVEHNYNCDHLVEKFRDKNVFVNCTNQNVIRVLPPLIAEKEHIDYFVKAYVEIVKNEF